MVQTMVNSDNKRVAFMASFCMQSVRSVIGKNLRKIAKRLEVDVERVLSSGRSMLLHAYIDGCTEQDHIALSLICEMRECVRGNMFIEGFNVSQFEDVLYEVCEN